MHAGFSVKVSSAELKAHCAEMAKHYVYRAERCVALAETLEKGADGPDSSVVKRDLHRVHIDMELFRQKSETFGFYAAHLFDDDYELDFDDLRNLEFLPKHQEGECDEHSA